MDFCECHVKHADKNTCQWLLNHAGLQELQRNGRGLLWLKGKAGCGKSVLMKHLLHQLPGSDGTCTVSFFFSSGGTALQKTRLGFLRSVIYQLARRFPKSFKGLVLKFERTRALLPDGTPIIWQAQELFDALLEAVPWILKTCSLRIFADAIDECGDDAARKLIEDLRKLVEKSPSDGASGCSVLYSSRSLPSAGHAMTVPAPTTIIIPVDQLSNADIHTFVRYRLPNHDRQHHDDLTSRADGVFLWAGLLAARLQLLDPNDSFSVQKEISRTHRGDVIGLLNAIFQDASPWDADEMLRLMVPVCFSVRPLRLSELRIILSFDANVCTGIGELQYRLHEDLESRIRTSTSGLL